MEGRLHHQVLTRRVVGGACAIAALVVGAIAPVAAAPLDVDAGTDPTGATVEVVDGSVAEGPSVPPTGGGCSRRYIPANVPAYLQAPDTIPLPPALLAPAPSPDHRAFHVFCGDRYITTVWAIPRTAVAAIADRVAHELLARIEFPPVTIGVNPAAGLAGLESWYWIDGYDGAPVTASRAEFGISIDLEVRLSDVRWDFGDGTAIVAGLGEPYPTRSSVAHTSERSGTYGVHAGFGYRARYRVGADPWTDLEAVPHTATREYTVREVRSVLTR